MNKYRLMDISFYYWLKDIVDRLNIVKLVEGFLDVDFESEDLPIVAFDNEAIKLLPFELGSRKRRISRTYIVYVFAKTKKQRDDLLYEILNEIENPIAVYNYNEGFPPDPVSKVGYLVVDTAVSSAFSYKDRNDSSKYMYVGNVVITLLFDEHTE